MAFKESVQRIAFEDITKYLKEEFEKTNTPFSNVWGVVTPAYLNTKKNRFLNKLLGLHKINKYGQAMARNKTKKY
jgi:hypothetical protein